MPYKSTDFDKFIKDIFQSQVNMLLKKNRLFNCDQKPTLGTVRLGLWMRRKYGELNCV